MSVKSEGLKTATKAAAKAVETEAPKVTAPVEEKKTAAPAAEKKPAAVKKAAAPKKEAAKPAAEKKAAAPKKEAAKPAAEKKAPARKTSAKKEAVSTVYIEYAGKQIVAKDILEAAKKAYGEINQGAVINTIEIYVKPEENAAYYVVNGEGSDQYKVVL